jgi:hypothetical protein
MVIQTDFNRSGSPFSLREKGRMREIKSSSMILIPSPQPSPGKEREKRQCLFRKEAEKIVPLPAGQEP